MTSGLRILLLLLPLAIFIAIGCYMISFHHVWPLSRDQWHMYAPYFEKGLWEAALTPMSNHRHLVPFLFFHIDMAWFGGLNHFLVFTGAVFNLAVIVLLLFALYRHHENPDKNNLVTAIWIVFMFSWLINIAQLGWGFMSTQYYLAIFCCLFSVFIASHSLVLAIIAGSIATFSFGMGILVWPVLLLIGWLHRAPIHFYIAITTALGASLAAFMLMPGGDSIRHDMLFYPTETLRFVFQLPSGPIYYLLKSYRFIDIEVLQTTAIWISAIAVTGSLFLLGWISWRRPTLSVFLDMCVAMVLLGLGSSIMITFIRTGGFLDTWVDRYQIWAILFWCGFLPLCCYALKRTLPLFVMGCLSLVALPSQLDMGARLSEYNIRVEQSLLAYQIGLPEREAAEDALHWNWENKLPYFFTVWDYLRREEKNIFRSVPVGLLGSAITTDTGHANIPDITLKHLRELPIYQTHLLDLHSIPQATNFALAPSANQAISGYKIYTKVDAGLDWDYAIWVNEAGSITGLGIKISQNRLPRGNLKYIKSDYNLYSVVRNEGKISTVYLLDKNGVRIARADQ